MPRPGAPVSHTISTRRTDKGPAAVGPLSFKNLARILNQHFFQVFHGDALPLEHRDHVVVNVQVVPPRQNQILLTCSALAELVKTGQSP